MHMITPFIYTLLVLSLSIFFHEMGHFISALLCGAIVKEFSLGFGPVLKSWKFKGIQYSIRSFLLGGFVKIVGDDPDDEGATNPRFLQNLAYWKRFIILSSGVIANILFALTIIFAINYIGFDMPDTPVMVRSVSPDSPAQNAGMLPYDVILQVEDQEIDRYDTLSKYIAQSKDKPVHLILERDGKKVETDLAPAYNEEEGRFLIGVFLANYFPPVIGRIQSGSLADKAGLMPMDRILSVENQKVYSYVQFEDILAEYTDTTVTILFERDGSEMDVPLPIEVVSLNDNPYLNVGIEVFVEKNERIRFGFVDSIKNSFAMVKTYISLNFRFFRDIARKKIAFKKAVGGPVEIVRQGIDQANAGPSRFWNYVALLNISLFLFNALPIPLLDGGHIMFLFVEMIIGRRIPKKVMGYVNYLFFMILMSFAAFVIVNDVIKIFS